MGAHVENDTSETAVQITRYASRALAMTPFEAAPPDDDIEIS
jgi:hypothetical protein